MKIDRLTIKKIEKTLTKISFIVYHTEDLRFISLGKYYFLIDFRIEILLTI